MNLNLILVLVMAAITVFTVLYGIGHPMPNFITTWLNTKLGKSWGLVTYLLLPIGVGIVTLVFPAVVGVLAVTLVDALYGYLLFLDFVNKTVVAAVAAVPPKVIQVVNKLNLSNIDVNIAAELAEMPLDEFRALNPHVRPGSKVAFLDDPFHSWDMLFLAELWFRDRSVDIHVERHGPLTPEELAKVDYIFTFRNGKLVELK